MTKYNVFMWVKQSDGTRERIFFGADNKSDAIDLVNKKQHLTKEKIIVRELNNSTGMYETFLVVNN